MKYRLILLFIMIFCGTFRQSTAQSFQNAQKHPCLKCHANQSYTFHNDLTGKEDKRLMNPYYILDTVAIAQGNHKSFDCTDCHSAEYATYPHLATLKLAPMNSCLDCHGGDATYATFKFEKIQEEFKKSIHYKAYGDNFTCSKCHSQHTYKTMARTSNNVLDIVAYDNQMCLSCHNNMKKYKMVSGHDNPQLVAVHSWLPNQELHFNHVRCIECHTAVDDSLMVSHDILPKDKAVRKCDECHSANSKLKASLYKYRNLQKRAENKGIDAVLSNESYIIGTHQIPILKLLSIIIFVSILIGIVTHSIFRILKKK